MCKSREWLVEGSEAFWVRNDVKLRTLGELAAVLAYMPGEVYASYVDESKNNFADWVASSFQEQELADAMRGTGDREGVRVLILNSIGE